MDLWNFGFTNFILRTSWPFLIYDFERSFAVDIEKKINTKLKKWAGINLRVDNGLLFRSKANFGLGLTSIIDHYERMQLIKCELLQNSNDSTVQNYIISEQTKMQNSPKFGKRQIYPELLMLRLSWTWSLLHKIAIKELDLKVLIQIPQKLKRENL